MRIIKYLENYDDIIAGEMLNLEYTRELFINGEYVGNKKQYPILEKNGIRYEFRPTIGVIITPPYYNNKNLITRLYNSLAKLEKLVDDEYKVMQKYTTVSGIATAMRCKTFIPKKMKEYPYKRSITCRLNSGIYVNEFKVFNWYVRNSSNVDYSINDNLSLIDHIFSIMFDAYDTVNLPHNHITYEFNHSCYKNISMFTGDEDKVYKLCREYNENIICYEINDWWRKKLESYKTILQPIKKNKIYNIKFEDIKIRPVPIADGDVLCDSICAACKFPLYDDNYALYGSICDPDEERCLLVCPICAHSYDPMTPLESNYLKIYKFKYPRTLSEVLLTKYSEEEFDILVSLNSDVNAHTVNCFDGKYILKYLSVGKKYIAIDTIDKFAIIYSEIHNHPDFKDRKIILIDYLS